MAHIEDNEMILRYHQFNTEDIRAITKILSVCINFYLNIFNRIYFSRQISA